MAVWVASICCWLMKPFSHPRIAAVVWSRLARSYPCSGDTKYRRTEHRGHKTQTGGQASGRQVSGRQVVVLWSRYLGEEALDVLEGAGLQVLGHVLAQRLVGAAVGLVGARRRAEETLILGGGERGERRVRDEGGEGAGNRELRLG